MAGSPEVSPKGEKSMKFVKEEKPVKTEHPLLGELSVDVETPAVDSVAELTTFCGGENEHVAFGNSALSTAGRNRARAYMRTYKVPEGTAPSEFGRVKTEIAEKAAELSRTYTPETATTREPSQKKKAEKLDLVRERLLAGEELSREELLQLVNY
jgi:hypothetical protein